MSNQESDGRPKDDSRADKTKFVSQEQNTLIQELARAKEQDACLILIRGFPQGQRYFLTKTRMTIGRDPNADLVIMAESVSRRHAEITKTTGGLIHITDCGSANGTFINEVRLNPHTPMELEKEDMLKLGEAVLKYLPAGELETLYLGYLSSAANTDALTGVHNKGYLLKIIEVEFKRTKSIGTPLSIIFFDIDHFKKINDTYGHEIGDEVLKAFSQLILEKSIRTTDIVARYGGEEFVLILLNTPLEIALQRAENIRLSVEKHIFFCHGQTIRVTVSGGVQEVNEHIKSQQELLEKADAALYAAKTSGRNQIKS